MIRRRIRYSTGPGRSRLSRLGGSSDIDGEGDGELTPSSPIQNSVRTVAGRVFAWYGPHELAGWAMI